MDDLVQFVSRLIPDWLVDRLDDLFHAPFWKVLTGAVIATLTSVAFFALPPGARDRVKLAVIFAGLALAAFELYAPLERVLPLG